MNRRQLFRTGCYGIAALSLPAALIGNASMIAHAADGKFEVEKTEAEWRQILTEAQFDVLRQEDTERPFTSTLLEEYREGTFHCAACDLPAYGSYAKYDSGTGWPSFYEALQSATGSKQDDSLFSSRTEIHCARCGGHFGHVFDDGPKPTGMRHCLNGVALKFVAKAA